MSRPTSPYRVLIADRVFPVKATRNMTSIREAVKQFREKYNIAIPIDYIIAFCKDDQYGLPYKIRAYKVPMPPKDAPKITDFAKLLTQDISTYKLNKVTGREETKGRKVKLHGEGEKVLRKAESEN